MSLAFETVRELSARLDRKEISSRELTETFIARIEKYDEALNAVVVRDFDRALGAADASDAARARGERLGALGGIPMTVKEAYDIEGLPTTWGVPAFANNLATSDAAVVRKLGEQGAHFLGKTNVPLQLADFQSYNDIYGTTNNPWNVERGPGGSSGGSAAALAAGLSPLEFGSDIGGSIRNPAHFCGVYGHKPTWSIVPAQGHALPGMVAEPDIAVLGPMARSAEDLALALDIVAGPGPFQAGGWKLDLPRASRRSLSEYRVALLPTHPLSPVSGEVSDRVQQVGDRLAKLGARVSDTARPEIDLEHSLEVYLHMLNGVISAGFPDEVFDAMTKIADGLDPGDRSFQAISTRASVQRQRTWVRMDHARARLRQAWSRFFEDVDVLVCPISPTTAFSHDHTPFPTRTLDVDGVPRLYAEQLFWAGLVTVAYLPSTVFPTGPSSEGLPIGLQAVGPEFHDHRCIDFTRLVAEELGGFTPPPGYDD